MNRKIYLLGALAMLPLLMASCKSAAFKTETRSITASHSPVLLEPKFVDYTVDLNKKATAMVEGRIKKGETPEIYVNRAAAQAAVNSGADFLFEPVYEVETRKKRITVKASGYPAKYSSVRKLNFNDSLEVKFYNDKYRFDILGLDEIKGSKKKKRFLVF